MREAELRFKGHIIAFQLSPLLGSFSHLDARIPGGNPRLCFNSLPFWGAFPIHTAVKGAVQILVSTLSPFGELFPL